MKSLAVVLTFIVVASCVDVKDYLQKYGYYNPNSFDQSDVTNALKTFQNTFSLSVTGVLDDATKDLMQKPRCGVSDHAINRNSFAGSAWGKKSLTYYFSNYSPDLDRYKIDSIIAKAFKFWSDVTPLRFTKTSGRGDIVLAFGSRAHSDNKRRCGFPFDGRSGVLAHAFFPSDGRLHFDEDENWTEGTSSGQNLLGTAVHEIGHILGLEHDSSTRQSIMYPYAASYDPNLKLHGNDIRNIQTLYGGGTGGGGVPTPPRYCRDEVRDCYNNFNHCNDNPGSSWRNYMDKYCRKTCRRC